jgi:hypothetical protein
MIALSQFGVVQIIKGVFWSDTTGNPQSTFYVEDLAIVGDAPVPDPAGPALQVDLDVHCYPGASGVAFSSVGDDRQDALRVRSTRMLWDTTYVEEAWENRVKAIISSMRALVDQHDPGTKLAWTEYNWVFAAARRSDGALTVMVASGQ